MQITKGSKVLITGAASGIGRALALAAGRLGARLFLTDRNDEGLDETCVLAEKAGGEVALGRAFDITSLKDVRAFADDIHRKYGALDLLVNNAGIALFALIEDMSHEQWEKVINVNLWGPIHGIECFLPEMIKAKRGHLVNVSSSAGLTGAPWHAAYSTAKWGLVGLSEVLRYDLAQHGITVSVVCPGAVDTPLKHTVEIPAVDRESPRAKKVMALFEKRAVTPEAAAETILDAVSKEKFLVFTSPDIKHLYYLKRFCFPAYHQIMKRISRLLNSTRR